MEADEAADRESERYLKQWVAVWCQVSARRHIASKITWTCPTETVRGQKHPALLVKNNPGREGAGLKLGREGQCGVSQTRALLQSTLL